MVWTKRISFTLWPVGQGLFTLVDTWVGSRSHRIVYDCGTSCSSQQLAAEAFTAMRNRSVDLLVVSHFHRDHISRIPQLFKSVPEVKEVWIPYLSPKQRLLFAFSSAVGGMLSGSDEVASGGAGWFESRGCSVQEVGVHPPRASDIPVPIPPDEPRVDDSDRERPLDAGDDNPVPPRDLRLSPLQSFPDAFNRQSNFKACRSELEAVGSNGVSVDEAPVELLTWILPITRRTFWNNQRTK
jgi:glyoxylase-like metal-dependent hydrolase (beta-lactamase superfamily II)